jgi:hypothetical protein
MSEFDFLSITRGKLILFFSATLTLALLISVIMILSFTCGQKPGAVKKPAVSAPPEEKSVSVAATDLMLEEYSFDAGESYYLFRDRMKRWTKDQVDRFFIPVQEILRDYFKKKNDNRVKDFFDSIE